MPLTISSLSRLMVIVTLLAKLKGFQHNIAFYFKLEDKSYNWECCFDDKTSKLQLTVYYTGSVGVVRDWINLLSSTFCDIVFWSECHYSGICFYCQTQIQTRLMTPLYQYDLPLKWITYIPCLQNVLYTWYIIHLTYQFHHLLKHNKCQENPWQHATHPDNNGSTKTTWPNSTHEQNFFNYGNIWRLPSSKTLMEWVLDTSKANRRMLGLLDHEAHVCKFLC